MFVLSYVLPPTDGAAFGKATISGEVIDRQACLDMAGNLLIEHGVRTMDARIFTSRRLWEESWGTDVKHETTGIVFRIVDHRYAPHACPCCGRLIEIDEGGAFAGQPDAYCTGCYTWGDATKISCAPEHTAHANPWSTDTTDARWHMHVVIDDDGETGEDDRYATDKPEGHRELWDDVDNALIAWPGLDVDQIIEVTITEINEES